MQIMAFHRFLKQAARIYYKPAQILDVLAAVQPFFEYARNNTKLRYYDVPCSFDIETTSTMTTGEDGKPKKTAFMYEWTFGIFGSVIVGRTWEELTAMFQTLAEKLRLDPEHYRLICYVHNLQWEFQFIRLWFNWYKVFAIKQRTPIYAITSSGIEFRCSYILSGYSLEKVGEQLRRFKVKKLTGSLDYSKIRHSKTPMTEQEIRYCINDVRVVMAYIAECIEDSGNISKIPLTKTGYVRNYCREQCLYSGDNKYKYRDYMENMHRLQLDPDEYEQLKNAFQGGFTHANFFATEKIFSDVTSYDFTSSYPAVIVAERFPMGRGELVEIKSDDELRENLKYYCCLFDVTIYGLEPACYYDSPLSRSRCRDVVGVQENNGRVYCAERLTTTITEQDFLILSKFYKWKKLKIFNFRRYIRGYLPTDLIKAVLQLYSDKTTLKGVQGKEQEYQKSKENLNSIFGMMVTDIVRDNNTYEDNTWDVKHPDLQEVIDKYNNNSSRFLFYPWGVWVTAYARRNLFTGIWEFGEDYLYSDTDSIKAVNAEKHAAYIDNYNKYIRQKLERALKYHNLPLELIEPETIEHEKKPLGIWDFDGHYSKFKTLGAKRYMVQYSDDERNPKNKRGEISLTVSGLNKKICVPWLLEKYGKEGIFDAFNRELYVDEEHTGKKTHTYIDEQEPGVIIDYTGTAGTYNDRSSIHLSNSDYSLSISGEYSRFLAGEFATEYIY